MIAARAATAILQAPNVPLLRALKPESEILDRISEAFARMLAFKEFDVHSYFEELPMGIFGKVNGDFLFARPPVIPISQVSWGPVS